VAANSPLIGKGLLTPLQETTLAMFAELPDQEQFYLTGGTALTEYYLGHRLSFDLDFFTGIDSLVLPVSYQIEQKAMTRRLRASVVRRFSTYVEFLVEQGDEKLRIDLALDSPFHFQAPQRSLKGYLVNSYQDLCVDKLLAYYGRAEPRDAVDLFFILQSEPLEKLLRLAPQKDTGFDLYWFAIALQRSSGFPDEADHWPVKMLAEWDPANIKKTFVQIAQEIMSGLEQ